MDWVKRRLKVGRRDFGGRRYYWGDYYDQFCCCNRLGYNREGRERWEGEMGTYSSQSWSCGGMVVEWW
jgi:hypothetical protein